MAVSNTTAPSGTNPATPGTEYTACSANAKVAIFTGQMSGSITIPAIAESVDDMAGVTLNATINNPATTRQQPGQRQHRSSHCDGHDHRRTWAGRNPVPYLPRSRRGHHHHLDRRPTRLGVAYRRWTSAIGPGRTVNDAVQGPVDHYGLRSTRTHRGQSHKTGVAEHWHYRLKDAIDQAIILRGSRDVDTADDNTHVVGQMVQRPNRLVQGKLEQEMACLRPLPQLPYRNQATS